MTKSPTFFVMPNHNLFSDQDGVNMSFQEKKFAALQLNFLTLTAPTVSLTKTFGVAVTVFEIQARFRLFWLAKLLQLVAGPH